MRSSEGWKEKLRNLIHLFAPLVSGKKIIAIKHKVILKAKRKNEKKIKFLREHCEIGCVIDKGKISPVLDIEESIRYYQDVIDQGIKDAK